jgi:predicted transcriptional regulator
MEVIRVIKSKDYTTICNRIYKNKNLSLKAKGLLSLILSLSTHWNLSVSGLSKICKEGKSSIGSTINELITNGYIQRKMIRDGNRIAGYQYTVFENPHFVCPENQDKENHQQYNTINNKVKSNKVSIEYSSRFKKPEISEIREYCIERNNDINAETFFNYYESKGWMIGKNKMKDWKASIRTWEQRTQKKDGMSQIHKHISTNLKAKELLKKARK